MGFGTKLGSALGKGSEGDSGVLGLREGEVEIGSGWGWLRKVGVDGKTVVGDGIRVGWVGEDVEVERGGEDVVGVEEGIAAGM